MKLFNYQVPAVEFALKNKRVLFNIPAGAGKTIIAGETITRGETYPALIVTPTSVKTQFKDELMTHFGVLESDIQIIKSTDKVIPKNKKIYIINPDILKKMYEVLLSVPFRMVVGDECHYFKSHKVIRTKAMQGLCKKAEYVILMSGTPMPLGIIDLYAQFAILRPDMFGKGKIDWFGFATRYCGGKFGYFGFEAKGATNLDELRQLTKNIMMTLDESIVLKDLPELQIIDIPIEMETKEKKEYDIINKDFENYLRSIGKTEYEVFKSLTNEQLVKLNALRRYTSQVKLKHIKEIAENLNEKIIIFFNFTSSVEYFVEEFGKQCRTVIGSDSTDTRDKNIEAFKNDPEVKYLLVNVKAGGSGLNLQNSRIVIFAELPWSWADFRQAYARSWRRGQGNRVLVYKPMVVETVDQKINKIIYDKKEQSDLISNLE